MDIQAKCIKATDNHTEEPIGLVEGVKYDVKEIGIGGWETDIKLHGSDQTYNSVNFEFYKDGEVYDIFEDSELNPYL